MKIATKIFLSTICCFFITTKTTFAKNETNACTFIDNNQSAAYGLNSNAINLARMMLDRELGDWKKLCIYSNQEIAKRLNALVYNACNSPSTGIENPDLNQIFTRCVTKCGGRAYMLRALLAVYGIHSQVENIYNIPKQGNHVTVEAKEHSNFSFYDPTFGVFFASALMATPLDHHSMQYYIDERQLNKFAYQANEIMSLKKIITENLNLLYSNRFNAKTMDIASYVNAEAIAPPDSNAILYLSANVKLKNNKATLGCLDAKNKIEADQCFLTQTNKLYAMKDPKSYVSYVMSWLGYLSTQMRINAFNFENLEPQKFYKIDLLINNSNKEDVELKVGTVGSNIVLPLHSTSLQIKPGLSRYEIYFKAKVTSGTILLYPIPGKIWSARLFAWKISLDNQNKIL